MAERLAHDLRQRNLARVAERRVAEIVAEGNGLGQVLVQTQARVMVRAMRATSSVCVIRVR